MTFQKVQQAYERLKAEREGYTLTEEDLQDMYASQMGSRYRRRQEEQKDESREEQQPKYSDEEMKQQFEAWKKTIYHEYDENQHDEFLSQRYYKTKKQDDFSTNSHFHHPNADSGPLRGPA